MAWFHDFFGEDFWLLVKEEYTVDRTSAEVRYLAEVLRAEAPGRRVVDLACGLGRHAVPLADLGFEVTGADCSAYALGKASQRSGADRVEWRQLDLVRAAWPLESFDAAILVQSWGWGTDAEQQQILRRIRTHLRDDGLLILDFSNAHCILANFVPDASLKTEEAEFILHREMDSSGTRCLGSVRVLRREGPAREYEHSFRLYGPGELSDLVARSGFEIVRVDADFVVGATPTARSRYLQIVARRRRALPAELAISRHRRAAPEMDHLDLRMAVDEADYCQPHPDEVIREVIAEAPERARAYEAGDPWASRRLATPLGRYLGIDLSPAQVFAGAGITGLVAGLARLAGTGTIITFSDSHPDLAAWIRQQGGTHRLADFGAVGPAAAIQVDRPSMAGYVPSIDEIGIWSAAAAEAGALLVVDEAYANYLSPPDSAASLCSTVDNLIVLRSLSKGFCCGGLRIGVAICSPALSTRMKDVLPPLATSAASVQIAALLLGAGDPLAGLRSRIKEVRPHVTGALAGHGLRTSGDERMPWVLISSAANPVLERAAIIAAPLTFMHPGGPQHVLRMSLPFTEVRLAEFRSRLTRF